jgi:hypothetical protein
MKSLVHAGLVVDKTAPDWPASIAATEMTVYTRIFYSLRSTDLRGQKLLWANDESDHR